MVSSLRSRQSGPSPRERPRRVPCRRVLPSCRLPGASSPVLPSPRAERSRSDGCPFGGLTIGEAQGESITTLSVSLRRVQAGQWVKAQPSMVLTESGIVSLVRLRQLKNALSGIAVIDFEMITLAKELQSSKACEPMLFTESGILTSFKDTQPPKAPIPISITESGMVKVISSLPNEVH